MSLKEITRSLVSSCAFLAAMMSFSSASNAISLTYKSQFGGFYSAFAITSDSFGNILVGSQSQVQKFNSSGVYQSQFGTNGSGNGQFNGYGSGPWDISVDSTGNIFVADTYNYRVQKLDSSGNYLSQIFGISFASAVAVDSSGNIFVADIDNNRVKKFNSSGVYQSQFGTYGFGDVAIDSDGNILVVDSSNGSIQKFDGNGNYLSQFGTQGSGDGQLYIPIGFALDSFGNIFIADRGNNRVSVFDKNGVFLTNFGSAGSGNGQFNDPIRLVISQDKLYVTDRGNSRVQIFDINGDNGATPVPFDFSPNFGLLCVGVVVITKRLIKKKRNIKDE